MAAYKDKSGKWYVSVYYDNWKGERDRKVKRGFATKKEALEWERQFLNQKTGDLDMTFGAFVENYKADMKERLKLSTWIMKTSIIDQKILPYFRNKQMKDIKATDVADVQRQGRENVFSDLSENDPQSAQRDFQSCGAVLRTEKQPRRKSRKYGQGKDERDAVLDEAGIPAILGSDDGQACLLLRF